MFITVKSALTCRSCIAVEKSESADEILAVTVAAEKLFFKLVYGGQLSGKVIGKAFFARFKS